MSFSEIITHGEKSTLKMNFGEGGFFCNCSAMLTELTNFFLSRNTLPDEVDFSNQFSFFKTEFSEIIVDIQNYDFIKNEVSELQKKEDFSKNFQYLSSEEEKIDDVSKCFFMEKDVQVHRSCSFHEYTQYSNYKSLDFDSINPFIHKYFSLSKNALDLVDNLKNKYNIDFEKTISVFYRGNDKQREIKIGSYDEFLKQIILVNSVNPDCRILIQTDEKEFLEYCLENFTNRDKIFYFEELPLINNNPNISVHHIIPKGKRTQFGLYYLSSTYIISQSKILLTHTGNSGLWSVLFRGNSNNVHQYLNGWI